MTLRAPYLDDGDVRLYVGDCVEVMREMDADSVDAVVCDPPYGLEFMGKEWDAPWRGDVLDEPASVGGFQDGNGGNPYSRSRIRFGIGAGFQEWCETWALEALRVLKPGGHLLAFGGTRTFHRLTCGIEDAGFEIRDCLSWLYGSGFPKSLDVSKAIDKAAGAEREVVGPDPRWAERYPNGPSGNTGKGADFEGKGLGRRDETILATAPATDAAREWQGWGTALKPGWEPCVVARKPLAGTVAENVQQHGTGALNIDGCRIAGDVPSVPQPALNSPTGLVYGYKTGEGRNGEMSSAPGGRWPANVAFDEEAAAMLDAQSGVSSSRSALMPLPKNCGFAGSVYGGDGSTNGASVRGHDDTGGASRFFYTAKASRADRSTNGANNTHPTVKPTDLMRWLVRLVTPPGGIVLDPFAGSGSTLVAARAEGVRAVGIEREDEYARIIADRLAQLSLFTEGME
jgi:site-specific DNA-methyltransferase (adenine-specific)